MKTRLAFKGITRHNLERAAGVLGVLLNTYAPKYDEAVEKLLTDGEKAAIASLIISFQRKLTDRVPVQP